MKIHKEIYNLSDCVGKILKQDKEYKEYQGWGKVEGHYFIRGDRESLLIRCLFSRDLK